MVATGLKGTMNNWALIIALVVGIIIGIQHKSKKDEG